MTDLNKDKMLRGVDLLCFTFFFFSFAALVYVRTNKVVLLQVCSCLSVVWLVYLEIEDRNHD